MMHKKLLILFIFIIINNILYSQINFDKGYFIDNNENKIECFIKNADWRQNPTEFKYKLPNEEEAKTKTIQTVKEFGIYDKSKFIRATLNVDVSPNKTLSQLTSIREPIFEEKTIFLKTIIEGEASLYSYTFNFEKRFFYKTSTKTIEQLIYKEFLFEISNSNISNKKVSTNEDFKRQLGKSLLCSSLPMKKVLKLEYTTKSLVAFFKEYNNCISQKFTDYSIKSSKGHFNVNIRPGLNSSSLSINNSNTDTRDVDFDKELSFRFGIEAEYIFPFNKNKWSVFIEPTYQNYQSEYELTQLRGLNFFDQKVTVDYSSIELPIGFRHYFFIGDHSKIFINVAGVFDFKINKSIDFETSSDLEIQSSGINFLYGIGYKFNDKYSIEVRNQTPRELLGSFATWGSEYKTLSVIFGYTIF